MFSPGESKAKKLCGVCETIAFVDSLVWKYLYWETCAFYGFTRKLHDLVELHDLWLCWGE